MVFVVDTVLGGFVLDACGSLGGKRHPNQPAPESLLDFGAAREQKLVHLVDFRVTSRWPVDVQFDAGEALADEVDEAARSHADAGLNPVGPTGTDRAKAIVTVIALREQLGPEALAQIAVLPGCSLAGHFLLGLFGHAYRVVLVGDRRNDAIDFKEELFAAAVDSYLKTRQVESVLQQPDRRRGDFLAKGARDDEDALGLAGVEDEVVEVVGLEKVEDLGFGVGGIGLTSEVVLVDANDFSLRKAGNIAGVLEALPDDVAPAVVELVLDDDEVAGFVESEEVEPIVGLAEAVEFLLDDEEGLAEGLGGWRRAILGGVGARRSWPRGGRFWGGAGFGWWGGGCGTWGDSLPITNVADCPITCGVPHARRHPSAHAAPYHHVRPL